MQAAAAALRQIVAQPGLEARCYLQAWFFLRALGEKPPESTAKKVLGVVIEVGMTQGTDLLAAYEDGSARYWNFSGAGVVWDRKDGAEIDAAVRAVLRSGQFIAERIGFWEGPRRAAPGPNMVRLNMLAPGGILLGEGPMAVLSKDSLAMPLLGAGIQLMQLLTAKAQAPRGGKAAP